MYVKGKKQIAFTFLNFVSLVQEPQTSLCPLGSLIYNNLDLVQDRQMSSLASKIQQSPQCGRNTTLGPHKPNYTQ